MDISAIYKHPEDVVAVTSSSGSITYGELYRRSENLAKHIIASGAKRVIVYGHKEYSMVLAYVACLRAGVPYIPVSPQQPPQGDCIAGGRRLDFMCRWPRLCGSGFGAVAEHYGGIR